MSKRLPRARLPQRDQLPEAKTGRGVVSRAEAESGIQNHHRLAAPGFPPAPIRFEQEGRADFERSEVAFPRFRPIFRRQFPHPQASRANWQSSAAPDAQAVPPSRAAGRQVRRVGREIKRHVVVFQRIRMDHGRGAVASQ